VDTYQVSSTVRTKLKKALSTARAIVLDHSGELAPHRLDGGGLEAWVMADAERVTPRTLKALRGFTQILQGLSGLTQTSQTMGLPAHDLLVLNRQEQAIPGHWLPAATDPDKQRLALGWQLKAQKGQRLLAD
jgi:hypothetical protein